MWGNTISAAAAAFASHTADEAPDLPALTNLLDQVLLSDLPDAASHLMARLQEEAAVASDVTHLMGALPPLANILRYGSVRQTDAAMVATVVDGMVARICIGLPMACASLDDDAAAAMFKVLMAAHSAIMLLNNAQHLTAWYHDLESMGGNDGLHGLIAGRCCRLLFDASVLTAEEAGRRMGLALSRASDPAKAATWIEGFLTGSGLLLIHDHTLWRVLDEWVTGLHSETFQALLPLLRRTFSTFAAPERRRIGERVRHEPIRRVELEHGPETFDVVRADAVLPLVVRLLGLNGNGRAS
jgi:hypothetical protein